ncbi:MAG: nitroreductase family protein [Candidatus Omnitrophica bacterium]|nr:nitroreductase family protein [Candidatus Omnitrophota bacterium]
MLRSLISKNRSYRRFYEDFKIKESVLKGLIELARLSPSAANLQPLKYILSRDPQKNCLIFPHLAWAGYLKDWPGPKVGERPSAYIVILGDTAITKTFGCDHGIAAQSILLGAAEKGLSGCMIGSIDREALRKALKIPDHLEILLVLAMGKPKEKVVIETVDAAGDIKYWRDQKAAHHVPKRKLEDLIIE